MAHQITAPNPADRVTPQGAASIGHLSELDDRMQVFVLYMRRWTSQISERGGVWNDATQRFGEAKAHRVIGALDIFLSVVASHAIRPIQRHGKTCDCLGEDEAALAEIIAGSGRQDGPLLRMLSKGLVAPIGFTETISAAAQLYDILCEPSLRVATLSGSTLH